MFFSFSAVFISDSLTEEASNMVSIDNNIRYLLYNVVYLRLVLNFYQTEHFPLKAY